MSSPVGRRGATMPLVPHRRAVRLRAAYENARVSSRPVYWWLERRRVTALAGLIPRNV